MKKKTYGVSGYIEWVAGISVGRMTLQVPFTGGAITKYGIVPAEYTTGDPVIQHIIESSPLFTSGRISILRTEKLPKEEQKERDTDIQVKKFSNMADAADFLRENFSVPASRISSAEAVKRIGLEHKIKITGI